MNFGDMLGTGIIIAFPLVFIGGSFYEFYGAKNFIKKLYYLGWKLVKFKEDWGDVEFQLTTESIETKSGEYLPLSNTTALFRYTQPLFSMQVNTPLPLKGVIELKDGAAHVTARIPLVSSVFIAFWLFGWTAGSLSAFIFGQGEDLLPLVFMLGGWVFLGAMLGYSYVIEKKRLLITLEEIKSKLAVPGTSTQSRKEEGSLSFELKNTIIFIVVIFGVVFGFSDLISSNTLKKITKTKDPQKLRLHHFESSFSLGKNKEAKEILRKQYQEACDANNNYNCRLLGYMHELDGDKTGALKLYVRSCSNEDPHSCYNIISGRKIATEEDLKRAKGILEMICDSSKRETFKACCDCYDIEKKKDDF